MPKKSQDELENFRLDVAGAKPAPQITKSRALALWVRDSIPARPGRRAQPDDVGQLPVALAEQGTLRKHWSGLGAAPVGSMGAFFRTDSVPSSHFRRGES